MAKKPTPGAPLFSFHVNWRFEGFREDVLVAGDTVQATMDEAEPYLGGEGVLTALDPLPEPVPAPVVEPAPEPQA